MAQATRARRLSAIRQLYRFAFLEGWRTDDPAALIKGPKRERALPGSLSEAEVDRLLAAAETLGRTPADRLRDTCLMQVLYATGLRVSELVSLPLAAVRGDPRMILIRGKGGRERMVPLSPPARAALAAWLAHLDGAEAGARPGRQRSAHLFPARGRRGHMTRERFFLLVKDLARARRARPGEGLAAHPAPRLRHAPAGARRRPAGDPDAARARQHRHDRDLHPRARVRGCSELVLEKHPLAEGTDPAALEADAP